MALQAGITAIARSIDELELAVVSAREPDVQHRSLLRTTAIVVVIALIFAAGAAGFLHSRVERPSSTRTSIEFALVAMIWAIGGILLPNRPGAGCWRGWARCCGR